MGDLDIDRIGVSAGFEDWFGLASSDAAAGRQCSDRGADEQDAQAVAAPLVGQPGLAKDQDPAVATSSSNVVGESVVESSRAWIEHALADAAQVSGGEARLRADLRAWLNGADADVADVAGWILVG